jgi:hypothetical protein
MTDCSELHEVGFCQSKGGMLQPPVGFTLNATAWPKYLVKTMAGARCAPKSCFRPEPKTPAQNYFQEGQKLEAVDRKNPHLICCATVGAINGETFYPIAVCAKQFFKPTVFNNHPFLSSHKN